MSKTSFKTASADETAALATRLAPDFRGQNLLFFGDLGLGKTTFIRALASALGVKSKIKSPTFVGEIEHEISAREKFIHLDLYRLDEIPLEKIERLQEIFADENATVAVEWSEKLPENLRPQNRIEIQFSETGEEEREIILSTFF